MTKHETTALKRELAKHEKGRGKRYPAELKARIVAHAEARRSAGESYAKIADELGLAFETIRRWCIARTARPTPARSAALVPVEVIAAPRAAVAIVSPNGFRLEGLDVAEAVAVLRALA